MSYKDLEAEITRWADLEHFAREQQAAVRQRKQFKKEQAKRDARLGKRARPDAPVKHVKHVTLLVEPRVPAPLHMFRCAAHWADQSTTVVYTVDQLSRVSAELEAIQMATSMNWVWLKTLSVVSSEAV